MNEKQENYLAEILPTEQKWVQELEEQAKVGRVPIMDSVGIHFVMQLIRMKSPDKILEVGTAIGYSALKMLQANPNASIITIEKDLQRYNQAIQNITQLNKQNQIEVIHGDALEKLLELSNHGHRFDFIFIDAAKGQYQRFFELAEPMLNENGIILSDNVLFRGYVAEPENAPKRYTKMVEKLRSYNKMLMDHRKFSTTIIPVGDGVAVSYKISE